MVRAFFTENRLQLLLIYNQMHSGDIPGGEGVLEYKKGRGARRLA